MFNWAKQQLANVAGTAEPIYGPEAIQPVTDQAKATPYTEASKDAITWRALEWTNVETQTFYFIADSGHTGMAQVIYSNVAGVHITCQFNTKVFFPDGKTPPLWSSDQLENHGFDDEKLSFFADDVAVTLSEDGNEFTIKSVVNANSLVDLKIVKQAPAFVAGKDGTSTYATDPQVPRGWMKHVFWPRNKVTGTIVTEAGALDFAGRGLFIHALQGMKPHHAAAKWNFINFQSKAYSAVMMEFVTPPSYGDTIVNVGGLAKDGEIVTAGSPQSVLHTETTEDEEAAWAVPSALKLLWTGKTKDGKDVTASWEGPLGERLDRVDVMAEVPAFLKSIIGGVAGTRPYIYQFLARIIVKIKIGEDTVDEEGIMFYESTFIS
ncbi:MAG: putative cell survival pathways protein [Geoglossum umbratile]|nr:MAG: putative cell survival pathways protein [Geoglossum umbratile]